MEEYIGPFLPPRPEEPLKSDCCGSGCSPCVFDIYQKQLSKWEEQCNMIISNPGLRLSFDSQQNEPLLSEIKFTLFQVTSIEYHTYNTFLYSFQAVKLESGLDSDSSCKSYIHIKRPLGIEIAQHIVLKGCCVENTNLIINRAYTPISDLQLHNAGCFKVLIKLYEDGRMSKFIQNLKENDITEWRGPYGDYKYSPNKYKFLIMFCAGTGIAPMYSVANYIVKNECDETCVCMIFGCRDFEDILLRNEIQELTLYWNFSAEIFLSRTQEMEGKVRYNETVMKGRIDTEVVNGKLAGKKLEQVSVLICGTKSFSKDIMNYIKLSGLPDDNVHLF